MIPGRYHSSGTPSWELVQRQLREGRNVSRPIVIFFPFSLWSFVSEIDDSDEWGTSDHSLFNLTIPGGGISYSCC